MADDNADLTSLTVDLLSAYLAANSNIRPDDLPKLIADTHSALAALGSSEDGQVESSEASYTPAVTARKSLGSRDHILSMIDGKPYKSLKRHLSSHGLTPESYRTRYGLAANYPMVAPGYSEARREVAKRLGLGRKPRAAAPVDASESTAEAKPAKAPRKPRAKKPAGADE